MDIDNQKTKYLVTDAVAKGVLIDGVVGLSIAAMVYVSPALLPVALFPALTGQAIALKFVKDSVFATMGYYIRDNFRDAGHEYIGGAIGGASKYLAAVSDPSKLLISAGAGALNGVLYEDCTNDDYCREEEPMNVAFPVMAEALDTVVTEWGSKKVTHDEKVFSGGVVGLTVAVVVDNVYVPAIPHIHDVVDCIYSEGHMDLYKIGGCSYDKASSLYFGEPNNIGDFGECASDLL
jgi:hypothetical protein